MATPRLRPLLLASAFLFGILALLAASLPAQADAANRSCKRIVLRASKHKVDDDSWVRVKGHVCPRLRGRHKVHVRMRAGGRWQVVDSARTRANGKFTGRVHVSSQGRSIVRLRATVSDLRSRDLRLHIKPRFCALSRPTADIGMSLTGCRELASDTASRADPRTFWGNVECGHTWGSPDLSRAQDIPGDGDTHTTATGVPQGDSNYRRLTVMDGDDYIGERCELGRNDHKVGPTAMYREGQRRATYISMRLPSNLPLSTNTWQTVMQMKQAQPADNGGGIPILFMGAYNNKWQIESAYAEQGHWSFPARAGIWTRFAFDVYYSQDPNQGWLQVSADLNADGDFDDAGERSPVIHAATLMTETAGPNGSSDGLAAGDPIPSHLRTGVYHNPSISCPEPVGCSIEVDNVQVLSS